MTLHYHKPEVSCDHCGRLERVDQLGTWFRLATIVGSMEHFNELAEAAEANQPMHMEGDFCSMRCLANWSTTAADAKDMEEGLDG